MTLLWLRVQGEEATAWIEPVAVGYAGELAVDGADSYSVVGIVHAAVAPGGVHLSSVKTTDQKYAADTVSNLMAHSAEAHRTTTRTLRAYVAADHWVH